MDIDYIAALEKHSGGEGMRYDDLQYDMSLEEIYGPRDASPSPTLDEDEYQEEEITCERCKRTGPRYEIEGHSCGEAA